jgi:hypothetical protein
LMSRKEFRSRWGPDRRRSGPHPITDFYSYFKVLSWLRMGSHFSADSHRRPNHTTPLPPALDPCTNARLTPNLEPVPGSLIPRILDTPEI